jgi:hypothetical protein
MSVIDTIATFFGIMMTVWVIFLVVLSYEAWITHDKEE